MTDFRTELRPAFLTMEAIATQVDELFHRNEGKAVLDSGRAATAAALGLYAKARKNADALYRLAFEGYGEDAMVLARTLVNMCIDLGFICGDHEGRLGKGDRLVQDMGEGRHSTARRDYRSYELLQPAISPWIHVRALGLLECLVFR